MTRRHQLFRSSPAEAIDRVFDVPAEETDSIGFNSGRFTDDRDQNATDVNRFGMLVVGNGKRVPGQVGVRLH
nr:hypothetical protein [Dyella sp. ASV24]